MQNMDKRDFYKLLKEFGYKKTRDTGSSHVIYEREVTIKDTISIPEAKKEINGPMADRLRKQMQNFESYVCMYTKGVK